MQNYVNNLPCHWWPPLWPVEIIEILLTLSANCSPSPLPSTAAVVQRYPLPPVVTCIYSPVTLVDTAQWELRWPATGHLGPTTSYDGHTDTSDQSSFTSNYFWLFVIITCIDCEILPQFYTNNKQKTVLVV